MKLLMMCLSLWLGAVPVEAQTGDSSEVIEQSTEASEGDQILFLNKPKARTDERTQEEVQAQETFAAEQKLVYAFIKQLKTKNPHLSDAEALQSALEMVHKKKEIEPENQQTAETQNLN